MCESVADGLGGVAPDAVNQICRQTRKVFPANAEIQQQAEPVTLDPACGG
jgi:hypothetical protein